MNFTITEFRDITFVVFFLYIFFETKIYLAIWASVFHLINMSVKIVSDNSTTYKTVIASYVVFVLVGYLYVFRSVLSGKEKPDSDKRFDNLRTDKVKKQRIGIAILLLLIINIAAIFIFRKGLS